MAHTAPSPDEAADPMDVSQLYQHSLKQWQRMMDQSAQAWGLDTSAFTAETVRQAQVGQEAWMRSLALAREALAELPGRMASGEPVSDLSAAFLSNLQALQAEQAALLNRLLDDSQSAWRQFSDEVLQATPVSSWMAALPGLEAAQGAAPPFDAFRNVFEQAFGRWLDTPQLGLAREVNEEATQAVDAFRRYKQAELAYFTQVASIWGQVFQNLGPALRQRQETQPVDSLRAASRLWASVVDDTFGAAFRDPAYIDVQRAYLEAGLEVKRRRRVLQEIALRALDLPTLTDLDDAGAYIHRLRRDNRALTRRLAETEARLAAAESDGAGTAQQVKDTAQQVKAARDYARNAVATLRKEVRAQGKTLKKLPEAPPTTADLEALQAQVAALTAQVEALQQATPAGAEAPVSAARKTAPKKRAAPKRSRSRKKNTSEAPAKASAEASDKAEPGTAESSPE